jgi:hypothetical protein
MGNLEIKNSLWEAITSNDAETLITLLKKSPHLLNSPISDDNKTNAATRAAYLDRPHILAALYSLGADLDKPAESLLTPLMWASARGNLECVKFLHNFGADLSKTGPSGITACDFAVLYGAYQTAFYLFNAGAGPTKSVEELRKIKEEMKTPYIDIGGFLMSLEKGIPPDVVPFFTLAPIQREPTFVDPVRDPNETWGHWANRVLEFERPPMVERSSLTVSSVDVRRLAKVNIDPALNNVTVDHGVSRSLEEFSEIKGNK